jgi:hypothetical protein
MEHPLNLSKMNSFDRVMFDLLPRVAEGVSIDEVNEACELLQAWWRRFSKIRELVSCLTSSGSRSKLELAARTIDEVSHPGITFDHARTLLSEDDFVEAMGAVLLMLPRDPTLRKKNTFCRSAQFVSLALLTRHFPGKLLLSGADESEDHGVEARSCSNAANLAVISLRNVLTILLRSQMPNVAEFRVAFKVGLASFLPSHVPLKHIDFFSLSVSLKTLLLC